MEAVWGVPMNDATFEDFRRIFKCLNVKKAKCNQKGLDFPTTCSKSPCDMCEEGKLIKRFDMSQRINIYNTGITCNLHRIVRIDILLFNIWQYRK